MDSVKKSDLDLVDEMSWSLFQRLSDAYRKRAVCDFKGGGRKRMSNSDEQAVMTSQCSLQCLFLPSSL